MSTTFLILGNQLFPEKHLRKYKGAKFLMVEDWSLCTYEKHHQLKIILFLSAMRKYAEDLQEKGYDLEYHQLKDSKKDLGLIKILEEKLTKSKSLTSFEIPDKPFEDKISKITKKTKSEWIQLPSPMFLSTRADFKSYLSKSKKPFMKTFYEKQRVTHKILLDKKGKPEGGKWSFDSENRKKMPKDTVVPQIPVFKDNSKHQSDVEKLVEKHFSKHPGQSIEVWFPTTRKGYLKVLDEFLKHSIYDFGTYQDAISDKSPFLFHSLISPGINMGLITPDEVVKKVEKFYYDNKKKVPLNSVEGFIRQVIGWREFIRGIYQNFSKQQETTNFWNHQRKLKKSWYDGTTGIPPVDSAIRKAQKYGYNHHIERLMVLSNIMLLCEINPHEVHKWFMEMYIDTSEWVMGPNVYGMGQFSDGGIFATKPYICGSNYLLKMSNHKKGDWCDVMDGLYWRFVDKHRDFFSKNPRLKMMMGSLDRMDSSKRKRIFSAAEHFIETHTQ